MPVLVLDLALALGLYLDEKYGEELGRGMWRLKFDADSCLTARADISSLNDLTTA